MTRYAFTGPSYLSPEEAVEVHEIVTGLSDGTEFTTGAADGFDTVAALAALLAHPLAAHRIVIPADKHNARVAPEFERLARELKVERTILHMLPPSKDPYRRRNEVLVSYADVLVASVRSPRFYPSGEWMTVNIARCAGVEVRLHVLGRG